MLGTKTGNVVTLPSEAWFMWGFLACGFFLTCLVDSVIHMYLFSFSESVLIDPALCQELAVCR